MKQTIKIFLVLLAIFNIAVTQTTYYLNSETGKGSGCGESELNPCNGLLALPQLTDEGTSIMIASGVYSAANNFPYSITNANITFLGESGAVFQCDTDGTTNCLTITSTHGPSIISFQNIQFTGFNGDENGTEAMISISAPYTVDSFRSVLHSSSSVVQFLSCEFSHNTFTLPPYTPPTFPPTGNQTYSHTHWVHPSQLLDIQGVYVEIFNSLFTQNVISAITAEYAHININGTTFSQNYANFTSQLISSKFSVVNINAGTINLNGAANSEVLITFSGTACYTGYDNNYISTQCLPNTIVNTQFSNNLDTTSNIQLDNGAWLQMSNSSFKLNSAYFSIYTEYSPIAVLLELTDVLFQNNIYGFVSALYAGGSYFESVTVDGTTGNLTLTYFFEIPPGSSLSINNLQYNASCSPFKISQSSVIMSNSSISTNSQLVPSIGDGSFPTTVYFNNTQFTLPNQLVTLQGLTNVFFDGCTYSTETDMMAITCFGSDSATSPTMVFFVGEENKGFSLAMCPNLFCDQENEGLCGDDGATVNQPEDNGTSSETFAWISVGVLALVVVILVALLGFLGFKHYKLVQESSYSSL